MKPKIQIPRNSRFAVLVGLIFAAAPSTIFSCGLAWKEPRSSHFEGTDHQGHVSIVEKIGEIGGGAGLSAREKTFPIYLIWNSSYGQISPYAGAGFDIPLLSSRMVAVDDQGTFRFDQPDGWWRLFWRDKKNPEILEGQGNWKGTIKGDIISLWADCGDKITLARGRIVQLQSKGRTFDYVYSGDRVTEIREEGSSVLKVDTNPDTGEVAGLSFGLDKKISFEWGRRPRIQNIAGKNLVGGMDPALTKLTLADGTEKNFEFGVDDKIYPTLKISERREIAWDPATKTIVKDGVWNYNINFNERDRFASAAIHRTDSIGQSESWFNDSAKRLEIIGNLDGSKKTISKFSSGNLNGKVRSVTISKENVSTLVRKCDYDERGRLVREFVKMGKPHTFTFAYNEKGQQTQTDVDGKFFTSKEYDAGGRLVRKVLANGIVKTFGYSDTGILQKIISPDGKVTVKDLDFLFHEVKTPAIQIENENAASKQ